MTHVTNVITSGFRFYENTKKLGRVRMQTILGASAVAKLQSGGIPQAKFEL